MNWLKVKHGGKDILVNLDNVFCITEHGEYRRIISIAPKEDRSRFIDVTDTLKAIQDAIGRAGSRASNTQTGG